ncbi:MAG: TatD family hydrolase [Planctomycetes bacterium]|nr:TatD family hydrolase [Planctomycetota bacterium]
MIPVVDSHAHLYWKRFDGDREAVLEAARQAGVTHIVVPGTNLETSTAARDLCSGQTWLHFAAGIHPSDSAEDSLGVRAAIEALANDSRCVAIGEAGLDFFHKDNPSKAVQEACFHWQLDLARSLDKPIIVHGRDAHDEVLTSLRAFPGVRGVMHCFTLGPPEMEAYLELGFSISFSGVVTFPKNLDNREAARRAPLDSLLVETDCPFLAPQPVRGQRNEPAFVRHVLQTVAEVRGMSAAELGAATTANAQRLFGWDGA